MGMAPEVDSWVIGDTQKNDDIPQKFQNPDELDLDAQKKRFRQDTEFRKYFSYWVMLIVPGWLVLTMVLMTCAGFGWMRFSDGAIIALLTTTTANVLGLAHIVLKGMFPEGNIKDDRSK